CSGRLSVSRATRSSIESSIVRWVIALRSMRVRCLDAAILAGERYLRLAACGLWLVAGERANGRSGKAPPRRPTGLIDRKTSALERPPSLPATHLARRPRRRAAPADRRAGGG